MSLKTIHFLSKDGLAITADEYFVEKPKGYVLLCHRSHFNRGEYRETALKLNELGYACLAIDQRSGMKALGFTNETYTLAKQKGLATGYNTAKPDIEAGIAHLYEQSNRKPVIILGSSYSASLALMVATENPSMIRAVIAFSPGEYLKNIDVAESIVNLKIPAFITSAKKEVDDTTKIVSGIMPDWITQFIPTSEGAHGSRVLWSKTDHNEEYWKALIGFLNKL